MRVFKFGGASIADADRMAALLPIIKEEQEPLLIVLSALGKTTNALENIVNLACKGDSIRALAATKQLEQQHTEYAKALLDEKHFPVAEQALKALFAELEQAVKSVDPTRYDYSYSQIVCMGELLSSRILSVCLTQNSIPNEWIDIRNVIRTDHTYRDGVVDWGYTKYNAESILGNVLKQGKVAIVQGSSAPPTMANQ